MKTFNFCTTFLLLIIFIGCKKIDLGTIEKTQATINVYKRFFNESTNNNPIVLKILKSLKEQYTTDDVKSISAKYGYPVWNKAILKVEQLEESSLQSNNSNSVDTFAIIPLVLDNSYIVSSYFKVHINGNVSLSFFDNSEYKNFTFENNNAAYTADMAAMQTMLLTKHVFGTKKFTIKDHRLFSNDQAYNTSRPDINIYLFDTPNINNLYEISTCYITYDWTCAFCEGADPHCPLGGGGSGSSILTIPCTGGDNHYIWPPIPGGTSGGGGTLDYGLQTEPPSPEYLFDMNWLINSFKDETNNPCTNSVSSTLATISNQLPSLIRNFFGSNPNFSITLRQVDDDNWTTNNGIISPPGVGKVIYYPSMAARDTFSIYINNYFNQATDLIRAATIIHEALHCQLVKWYQTAVLANDTILQQQLATEYGYLFPDPFTNNPTLSAIILGGNPTQHQDMMLRYRSTMALALFEFAVTKGYSRTGLMSYCNDLVWSGCFESAAFKNNGPNAFLTSSDRNRIIARISAELDPDGLLEDPTGNVHVNINTAAKGQKCN